MCVCVALHFHFHFWLHVARACAPHDVSRTTRNAELAGELSGLTGQLSTLAEALDSRLPATTGASCGDYPTFAHGTAQGHLSHTSPGAARALACDPGFVLNGTDNVRSPVVLCGADGVWSDSGAAACVPAPSRPPTASPTELPYELVHCCWQGSAPTVGVFADGNRLNMQELLDRVTRTSPKGVEFPSTAQVLGFHFAATRSESWSLFSVSFCA